MPRGGNPSPLTNAEWQVIARIARRGAAAATTATSGGAVRVLEGPIGKETAETLVENASDTSVRTYSEATLVRDYQRWLGRDLTRHTIRLPSGELLVTDAFDRQTGTLIEAKSSASRATIRTALGQLADYRRHLPQPPKRVAVLLPEEPTDDLMALLGAERVHAIVRSGRSFVEIAPPRRR